MTRNQRVLSGLLLAASSSALSSARLGATPRLAPAGRPRASVQLLDRRPAWENEQGAPIRSFLCQRAAQTLLSYAIEFGNDFEKGWLLRFSAHQGVPGLCTNCCRMLHAHDAFEIAGVTAEGYMHAMLRLPDETHQVTVVLGNRIGGGSPNNPYLKKERQVRKRNRPHTTVVEHRRTYPAETGEAGAQAGRVRRHSGRQCWQMAPCPAWHVDAVVLLSPSVR
jgi:hypothetical protein